MGVEILLASPCIPKDNLYASCLCTKIYVYVSLKVKSNFLLFLYLFFKISRMRYCNDSVESFNFRRKLG